MSQWATMPRATYYEGYSHSQDFSNCPTFDDWYNSLDCIDRPQFKDQNGQRIVYVGYSQCAQERDLFALSDYGVSSRAGNLFRLYRR